MLSICLTGRFVFLRSCQYASIFIYLALLWMTSHVVSPT